jgi:hypothetical protein
MVQPSKGHALVLASPGDVVLVSQWEDRLEEASVDDGVERFLVA